MKVPSDKTYLQDIQEAYVFVPLENRQQTLVYFFSNFNFGTKAWSIA